MQSTEVKDVKKAMDFAESLLNKLNGGAICLMISIGHRVGLFDCMGDMEAATAEEIADKAGLNRRYVREWLDAMTVGGICIYDATTKKYDLPAEHAVHLTRKNATGNLAVLAQFIGMLGSVEDGIVDCFKNGGGVGYEAYARFHEIMAEESGQTVVPVLVEKVLPLAPGLHERLESGITAVDIGCGRGRALRRMASAYPKSKFVGFDLCDDAIAHAKEMTEAEGLTNIEFKKQDVAALDLSEEFDLITAFDSIHDQAKPDVVLKNIHRALKKDGVFLMQDIDTSKDVENNMTHPVAPMVYTISCMHCMTVSLAQGGAGLGAAWGTETAQRMLGEAGFDKLDLHKLEHDPLNCFFVARK